MLKCTMTIVCSFLCCVPLYAFDSELWPGEGKPIFFVKTKALTLYENPSTNSHRIKIHKIEKGDIIDYDLTLHRTIKAGIIEVRKPVSLSGRKFGTISYLSRSEYYSGKRPNKDYTFKEGSSFEYLQYRAEGSCLIRWQDEVYEIDYCPWLDIENTEFTVKAEPVNEWWIRVTKNHAPLGWLLIEEDFIEVKRAF